MKNSAVILLSVVTVFLTSINSDAQCLSGDCNYGVGTFMWSSGGSYTGEYYNGSRTGLGEYVWDDGSFYFGHFVGGKLDGKGYYQDKDGNIQSGTFTDGVLTSSYDIGWNDECTNGNCNDGVGIYMWKDGSSYVGEWKNGLQDGYGRMDWKDGSYYYGHFTANKLDGKGYYRSAEGKVMEGYFETGVFQGTTHDDSQNTNNNSQSGAAQSADEMKEDPYQVMNGWMDQLDKNNELKKNYQYTEYDFCTMLQKAVGDYPNGFNSFMGPKLEDALNLSDEYISNAKVSGSLSAGVSTGFLGSSNSWSNSLYEGSRGDALTKYNYYAELLNNCRLSCCTMVIDTNNYKSDNYESMMTYLIPFMVGDGYSEKFKKMDVEVELSQNIGDDKYRVTLRVTSIPD